MTIGQKILLWTVLPVIGGLLLTALLVHQQGEALSRKQSAAFREALMQVRRTELINYTRLARTALRHGRGSRAADRESGVEGAPVGEAADRAARDILAALDYTEDGYFFAYTVDGTGVVHPKQPWRVGRNWWDLTDARGRFLIRELIAAARDGGGFIDYLWEQPSSGEVGRKLGYAEMFDELGWMVGTGVYIDDIDREVAAVDAVLQRQIAHTTWIIIAIAATAVFAVCACGLALQVNERRLADGRLARLTKRVMGTQDEERRRVSRELHDGISQQLVAVKFSLEEAIASLPADGSTRSRLVASESHIDDTLVEIRRISHDLHPSVLDDLGLEAALEALVTGLRERTGMQVGLEGVAFRRLLPTDAKTALYRVAQEAFTNIERHSGASRVEVRLSLDGAGFLLRIADDGHGFDPDGVRRSDDTSKGLGLRNMSERMGYFGGRCSIRSTRGGTVVEATLPRGVIPRLPDRDAA